MSTRDVGPDLEDDAGANNPLLGEGQLITQSNAGELLAVMKVFKVHVLDMRDVPLVVQKLHNDDRKKKYTRYDVSYRLNVSLPDFATLFFSLRGTAVETRTCWFWSEVLLLMSLITLVVLSGEYGMRATTLEFALREHCGQQGSWHRAFFTFGCVAIGSMVASSVVTGYPCDSLTKKIIKKNNVALQGDGQDHAKKGEERAPRCRENCVKAASISHKCRVITSYFFAAILATCLILMFIMAIWGAHLFWQPWTVVYVNHAVSSSTTYCDPWGTPLGYTATLYLIVVTCPLLFCLLLCPILDELWLCPCAPPFWNKWVVRCFKNCMQRYNDVKKKRNGSKQGEED